MRGVFWRRLQHGCKTRCNGTVWCARRVIVGVSAGVVVGVGVAGILCNGPLFSCCNLPGPAVVVVAVGSGAAAPRCLALALLFSVLRCLLSLRLTLLSRGLFFDFAAKAKGCCIPLLLSCCAATQATFWRWSIRVTAMAPAFRPDFGRWPADAGG